MEAQYVQLVKRIMQDGTLVKSRNGNTKFLVGEQFTFDCNKAPLLTRRKMYYKGIIGELGAFFKGPKHKSDFTSRKCNYWNQWAHEDGTINIDYGNKWIDFHGVNQVEQLFKDLRNNPESRRMMITSWDPSNLANLDLPCCHHTYQFIVRNGYLDMVWMQRSVDTMVGLPSDIFLSWLMLVTIANQSGFKPGKVTMQLGHVHIYMNHEKQVYKYLSQQAHELPYWEIDNDLLTDNVAVDKIRIIDYNYSDPISFELNV
tara:strand:+ start:19275 stop:20048 length:774 start_codon:yes stop_codon:yes gene_type:complete